MLRVVRAAEHPEAAGLAGQAEWFMDYWNADGSIAEMCGNGVRVFARYLLATGLVSGTGRSVPVATRAGLVRAAVDGDDDRRARCAARGCSTPASAAGSARSTLTGTAVDVGNPHLVCALPPGWRWTAWT